MNKKELVQKKNKNKKEQVQKIWKDSGVTKNLGSKKAGKNKNHHGGTGAVFMTESAAPVPGQFHLNRVGCLMDCVSRRQCNAQIRRNYKDERDGSHQVGEVSKVPWQQHHHSRDADGDERVSKASRGQ